MGKREIWRQLSTEDLHDLHSSPREMGDYKPDLGMANTMDVWLTGYSFNHFVKWKTGVLMDTLNRSNAQFYPRNKHYI
jgi:hypothetical protein